MAAGRSLGGSDDLEATIEVLIEQGLDRYGSGDLDGALASWEQALVVQPDEPRALGYVEYVRANYPLLTGGAADQSELAVPFGLTSLDDDAAYEIEMVGSGPAALPTALDAELAAHLAAAGPGAWQRRSDGDGLDDGWFLDEDAGTATPIRALPLSAPPASGRDVDSDGNDDSSPAIEMEADEPDEAVAGGFADEEKTRDIGGRRLGTADFLTPMPPFAYAGAGGDLNRSADFDRAELTGERTREVRGGLGFLRSTADMAALAAASADPDDDVAASRSLPGLAWSSAEQSTVELRVRLRDLGDTRDLGLAPAVELISDPALDVGLEATMRPGRIVAGVGDDALDDALEGALDGELEGDLDSDLRAGLAAGLDGDLDGDLEAGVGTDRRDGHDDDDLTIERGTWARATSEHDRTRERRPGSALEVAPLGFDLDDDDDLRGTVDAPLVIVEDPLLAEAVTVTPRKRAPDADPGASLNDESDEFEAAATVDRGRALLDIGLAMVGRTDAVPIQVVARDLLMELDRGVPATESHEDRVRRRITALLERAATASRNQHHSAAVIAVDLALAEDPDSAVAQKLIHRNRDAILGFYQQFVGDLDGRPALAVAMHELAAEELDSRSAFLLSRIDGNLSFEEILDVAGMTRLEAFRYLARLLLRGILEVR